MSDILRPMKGGPSWIYNERYTIEAKAEGTPNRRTMMGPMLQALLEDRFHLKVHQETEEAAVYALTVAKSGPKLQRLEEGGCTPIAAGPTPGQNKPRCGTVHSGRSGTNRTFDVVGLSVAGFSGLLRGFLDRPVIDKTELTGLFNFHLEFAPDEFTKGIFFSSDDSTSSGVSATPSDQSLGQSIFGALQQQLGLKLEQAKGPHGFLVIDHVGGLSEN
jgi:uncharacterized protein (TIGR03435 family)